MPVELGEVMSGKESNTRTDAELIRQLEAAAADEKPVEAVFILRPDEPSQVVPSPERTEELTGEILERARQHVGSSEHRYNVFKNMGSFVVSADPAFVRELMSQPEIAVAMANQQPGGDDAEPVKKRPAPSKPQIKGGAQKKSKARSAKNKSAKAKPAK